MNCDGAAKGSPGAAGGGVIIRNDRGLLISGLSANFGRCTAFRAEVMALIRGLELAKNLQIKKLEIQLDSLTLVQALQSNTRECGGCTHDLNHIRNLLEDSEWRVKVAHIYREGNRAADWLANQGVLQEAGIIILDNVPLALSRILE